MAISPLGGRNEKGCLKMEEVVFAHGYERRKMQEKGKGKGKERKIYSELKGVEGIEVFQ